MTERRDLRESIYQALAGSEEVTASLGGTSFYDQEPQSAPFQFLTFGQTTERDWCTGREQGDEHTVTIHVWSRAGGRQKTQEIMDKIRSALNESAVRVDDNRRVKLRHEYSEARHDEDGETFHGIVRYKAVTESFG